MNYHLTVMMKRKSIVQKIPTKLKDFRNFLYVVWKHLALPKPTPIQFDIANYLQSKHKRIVSDRVFTRDIIFIV